MKIQKVLFLLLALVLCECKKKKQEDSPTPEKPVSQQVDDYVRKLGAPLSPEEEVEQQLANEEFEKDAGSGSLVCRNTTYRAGYGFNESIILDPAPGVIYPGALIDGNSIANGSYRPINLKRGPVTLSTELVTQDQLSGVTVQEANLANVQTAINQILNKVITAKPGARITFEVTEVHSSQQLQAKIGASLKLPRFSSNMKFDFSSSGKISKYLIKFVQEYFSVSTNAPVKPSDFIHPDNDINTVRSEISGTAPCYVSSVHYGRMAFFSIQSDESSKNLKVAIDASLKLKKIAAELDASLETSKTITNSEISGTIIGGSATDAANTINGFDGMIKYITNAELSPECQGVPISYKLSLLSNNEEFKMVNATQYVIRDCIKTTKGITLTKIKSLETDAGVYGRIDVVLKYEGENTEKLETIFSRNRDQAGNIGANGTSAFGETVQFNVDVLKLDKAYIEIRTYLSEKDDKAKCDTDDLSRGDRIDSDDDMYQVSGSFYLSDFKKRSNMELEDASNELYFSRVKVETDHEVQRDDKGDNRNCETTTSRLNPQLNIYFKYTE